MSAIKLQHISFGYNKSEVVYRDFNLTINQGEFLFVLGANGSGKSTLLKLILGAAVPQKGEVLFDSKTIKNLSAKSKHIGYVPQSYALDHEMNVKDTLTLMGSLHGLSRSELKERTHFLMETLGFNHLLDKRIKTLSGGQKQLVNIAVGIIHDPEVLLIDEPFVGLDYGIKSKIITFLNELNKTVVCVSHDIEMAENNASKVLLLEGGKIAAYNHPKELIQNHPYVLEELDLKSTQNLDLSFSENIKSIVHNNRLILTCPNQEKFVQEIEKFKQEQSNNLFSSRSFKNNLQSTLVGHFNFTLKDKEKGNKKGKKKKK